jgi:hypothetical protein
VSTTPDLPKGVGVVLAGRLGIAIAKREGHDLVSACVACPSSDAFRLHEDKGIAQCYSCGGRWSPFQLAERCWAVGNSRRCGTRCFACRCVMAKRRRQRSPESIN